MPVLKNASVVVNSVDLSDHVKTVDCQWTVDEKESTAMGDNTKHSTPGLKLSPLKVTFKQDFTVGKTDATLWPLFNAGTTFIVTIKFDAGATSATNPAYSGTFWLKTYQPVKGNIGDLAMIDAEFELFSGDVTRAIA